MATKRKRKKKRRYHTGIHVSPKAGECKYRPSWELEYMIYLDNNENVIKYEYEGFSIPYISNIRSRKIRKYYPDLFVHYNDKNVLIEIKPTRRLTNPIVKKKIGAAITWCSQNNAEFEIVTEQTLKSLGLLKIK